ncbi:MAG: acyl carrier protein [Rhodospirillales bacterium]|jgi:acyl carrier protein|nr:acyl carrier protein [Rhodospirillales bacterium]
MATEAEITATLGGIFAEVFGREIPLHPGLGAKDVPGWDSFKQIEIIMATEETYAIRFSTRELDSLQSVGDLIRVVAGKTG